MGERTCPHLVTWQPLRAEWPLEGGGARGPTSRLKPSGGGWSLWWQFRQSLWQLPNVLPEQRLSSRRSQSRIFILQRRGLQDRDGSGGLIQGEDLHTGTTLGRGCIWPRVRWPVPICRGDSLRPAIQCTCSNTVDNCLSRLYPVRASLHGTRGCLCVSVSQSEVPEGSLQP